MQHVSIAVLELLLDRLLAPLVVLRAEEWQGICHLPQEGGALEHRDGWGLAPDHLCQDLPDTVQGGLGLLVAEAVEVQALKSEAVNPEPGNSQDMYSET